MFGFSFAKLIVLIGLILAVWYGLKLVARIQSLHAAAQRRSAEDRRSTEARASARGSEVEELVKCGRCGSYVPARGASPCGRADCPAAG